MEKISLNEVSESLGVSVLTLKRRLQVLEIPFDNNSINKALVDKWKCEKDNSTLLDTILNNLYIKLNGKNKEFRLLSKIKVIVLGNDFYGATVYTNPIWNTEKHFIDIYYIDNSDVEKIELGIYEAIFFHIADDKDIFKYLITNSAKNVTIHSTIQYISDFANEERDIKHINELINFLRFNLKKDIHLMEDVEFKNLLQRASDNISEPSVNMLIKFQTYLKKHNIFKSNTIFSYNKHQNTQQQSIEPYDINIYYSVAYMVFNKKYWDEQQMIRKAVDSYTNAKVWLYHAMHFITAWRSSDIRTKLPRFTLIDIPEITLEKIKNNQYSDQNYITIAEQIYFKFQYRNWDKKPEKIKANTTAHPLRMHIAESVKPVIGMLAMLCEAHNELQNDTRSLCEMHSIDAVAGYRLFGQPYADLLDNKVFSNRRANKSFLNLLNENANEESIDGYMIAAYARSHTGGFEHIPEVTSRYLKAKMDGLTKDDIAKQLFERGVCSFVPYLLCLSIEKDEFQNEDVLEQTQRIKALEMSPKAIETLISNDNELSAICQQHIIDIMNLTNTEHIGTISRTIIENIISGNVYGKQEGIYCLVKACGKTCVYRQRESCVGCGYEMYEKTLFMMLSQEIFKQESYLKIAKTKAEHIKRSSLLENKLYPAAYEMLAALSKIYSVDITEFKKILKRSDIYGIIGNV